VVEDGKVVEAGHGGGSIGGTTGFTTYPQQRAVVAVTGNMSNAPTGGMLPLLILGAFLDPASLAPSTDAPDLSGEYMCTMGQGEESTELPLVLMGDPGAHWGRLRTSPIIQVISGPSETRIIAANQRGQVNVVRLTVTDPDHLAGDVNRGRAELNCERR
jgi:hypothetical protein